MKYLFTVSVFLSAVAAAGCQAAGSDEAGKTARTTCAQFPQNPDAEKTATPKVPGQFASYVEASETTITVQRMHAPAACIDIAGNEVYGWQSSANDRLLGIGIEGYEYNSYLVIDRSGTGEPIETGKAPTFSPSGRRFASVDVSEASFGVFEALGIWDVTDTSIRNLITEKDLLSRGNEWKFERWASDDCAVFSSTNDASVDDLSDRKFYELKVTDQPQLKDVAHDAACQ